MKTALITGATSGIGKSTAIRFAVEGFKLILCGRRTDRLEQLQSELSVETSVHILNFDVEESIVALGNGGYNLKPVIRLIADADAGIVVGSTVIPATIETNVQSLVKLSNSGVTVSAYTDADGNFALNGVPAGTYDLQIIPEASSGLTVYAVSGIEVRPNETTDLGALEL